MIRFIFTGRICATWPNFGGLPAQFCMISVVLHLSIFETAAFAIAHDAELRGRIHHLSRRRDTQVDLPNMISEENGDVKRYLKTDLGKGNTPC